MSGSPFDFACPLSTISCRHEDGSERKFEVRVEPDETGGVKGWSYYVRPIEPPDRSSDYFYACVEEVEPGLVQMTGLRNNLPQQYHKCGITRALIPVISRHLSVTIRSSKTPAPPAQEHDSGRAPVHEIEEMRSEAATRVWQRMVSDHSARYDRAEDRFYYDRPASAPIAPE